MNHTNTTHPRNTTTTTTTSTTKISPWNQQQTTNLRNSNNGTTSRSGSNLSSFLTNSKILNTPKTGGATNTNINGASPLSKSVSSDTDAVLHRYPTEYAANIRYSGYLLKRSNQPYDFPQTNNNKSLIITSSSSSSSSANEDCCELTLPDLERSNSHNIDAFSVPHHHHEADHNPQQQQQQQQQQQRVESSCGGGGSGSGSGSGSDTGDANQAIQQQLSKEDSMTKEQTRTIQRQTSDNSNNIGDAAFRLAASFFGYYPPSPGSTGGGGGEKSSISGGSQPKSFDGDSSIQSSKMESSPILQVVATKSKPIAIVGGSSTSITTATTSPNDACYTTTTTSPTTITRQSEQHCRPPPDHHDVNDGHIWRAKYCVLEHGVIYFYRNATDGNSSEAQEERDRIFPFRGGDGGMTDGTNSSCCVAAAAAVGAHDMPNRTKTIGTSSFEADHLARSPMPRNYFHNKTGGMHQTTTTIGTASIFEVDHLAKSPMFRNYLDRTTGGAGGGIRNSYSLDSSTTNNNNSNTNDVIWEKRVALDRVGSVLASEMDFGKSSFVLLGIDPEDDSMVVEAGASDNSSHIRTTLDGSSSNEEEDIILEDRLILRADSPDEMRNWIFEIHRSLQILVNTIVRNRVVMSHTTARSVTTGTTTSSIYRRMHPCVSNSAGHLTSHLGFGGQNSSFSPVTPPATVALLLAPGSGGGGGQSLLTASMELSHGHGRSGLHRQQQQVVEQRDSLIPYLPVERHSPVIAFASVVDRNSSNIHGGIETPVFRTGSTIDMDENDTKRANSLATTTVVVEPIKKGVGRRTNKASISCLSEALKTASSTTSMGDTKRVANPIILQPKMVGKYVPPQMRGTKYVPPHRRNETAGGQDPIIEPPSTKSIFMDKSGGGGKKLHLESTSEDDDIPPASSGTIYLDPQPSPPRHCDSDVMMIGPSKRLGGCADPTLIQGSICDPMYIPKKASKVGKVNSKPFGGFGGFPRSGEDEDKRNNTQWEVGAVSNCGIRSANEDAYLVLNDLLGEPTTREVDSTSFFKSFQSHGIFAIFDGHCGNHTARFAAEKFPSILLDESMKDKFVTEEGIRMSDDQKIHHLLESVLTRLDREFCDMCTANGRDWDSGATALVATVIGNTLAVAGLGDSNGVLCCALRTDRDTEEGGWTILEDYHSNGCNTNHEVDVVWKEVVKTHSPSREDEKKRIEDANGWITTETEISCSQIHRVNWDDYDVIDIVGRSSGNGHAEVGRILTISRVCGDLAVSRALGDREFKAAYNIIHTGARMDEEKSAVEWESDSILMKDRRFKGDLISSMPEINLFNLGEGKIDEFLLLACDGLWDVMDAIDAVRITRNLLFDKGFSAKESADRLAELAYGLGSSDNLTVIVVHFHVEEKRE